MRMPWKAVSRFFLILMMLWALVAWLGHVSLETWLKLTTILYLGYSGSAYLAKRVGARRMEKVLEDDPRPPVSICASFSPKMNASRRCLRTSARGWVGCAGDQLAGVAASERSNSISISRFGEESVHWWRLGPERLCAAGGAAREYLPTNNGSPRFAGSGPLPFSDPAGRKVGELAERTEHAA